ncbi:MAG: GFA family protein [Pseudomonadota bacterium]|nr:GFA family protein [Pseudomonadota bacterium]
MSEEMMGGCACGRVRYRARVAGDDAYLCHCRMCQRATGGVSVAFKNLKKADVTWLAEPDWYKSSAIARRPYCRECGTSLGFEYPDSANMDLTIGSFDDPSRFRPTFHFGVESMHRPWLNSEGLPEHRVTDNKKTVERWVKAIGKLPD